MSGSPARALATSSRCRCPPERSVPRAASGWAKPPSSPATKSAWAQPAAASARSGAIPRSKSVSYTHLDVYKRQAQDFALPGRLVPGLVPLWGELVHPRDQKRYFDSIDEMLAGRTDEHNVEYQVKNRGGEYVWVVCRGLLNRDEVGRPVTFAGVVAPIANKGKIDPTTGLFTQGECRKRVERLLEQAEAPGGILLLGLDDFKRINNLKNHIFGDSVLRQIAQNLQRLLPPRAEAYRFDGDEFAVVCPGASPEEMERLYRTIHLCANREQEVDGTPYFCTISGGTAQIGRDADNYLDLLKYAESALEASKDGGKNRCTAFTPDLLKQRIRKMELTSCLQQSCLLYTSRCV